jgi:DNA-binding CsgD family transcriptional regulator/PAS domain-containing protein
VNRDDLIGDIYEAGALPGRWAGLLQAIAGRYDALGGNLFVSSLECQTGVTSPGIEATVRAFAEEGWNERNSRVGRLLARPPYPGFLTDLDLHSEEEVRTLPMYAEFLNPRGAGAGAGTLVQGAGDDSLMLTIEGFPSHKAARAAIGELDALRPHLARAATLSAQIGLERARGAVLALNEIGVAAAMLDIQGRVVAANSRFSGLLGGTLGDMRQRLRLFDAAGDLRLEAAIARLRYTGIGSSIGFSGPPQNRGMAALHLLPLRGQARDLFSGAASIALIADVRRRAAPNSDLLQALFELTPAEARVARGLTDGLTLEDVAAASSVSISTVRSQLKSVYQKTLTRRQSELVALLMQFGTPLS